MDIVIFGTDQLSSLAWYVLTHDSPHRVVGFTVDRAYRKTDTLHGLDVVSFEEVEKRFPPESCGMLAPLGWKGMNGLRAQKFAEGRLKGYTFVSYVSSRALVWPDLRVGENCMIHDAVIVQPFARIGDNCNLRSGCNISHHADIGDHCFIAAQAVVAGSAFIGERCVLGLNSTVRDGVRVAARCFIGAGAVVTADTEENGVYVGVPAKRREQPADQLDGVVR
jgi:sugar O-acyltransferase (sialic acid O-acetyltransferase NeuD family)